MHCPSCGHDNSRVVDSRVSGEGSTVRRRRACESCEIRFTTYERPVLDEVLIEKRDGNTEQFRKEKLVAGIQLALEKRPVPNGVAERIADEVEAAIKTRGKPVLPSQVVGEMVCERLIEVDEVAYLRFASVYKEFSDGSQFVQELHLIKERR